MRESDLAEGCSHLASSKKVLITGAAGFIGSCLAHRFVDTTYDLHLIKREQSNIWRVRDILDRFQVHDVDLADRTGIEKVIKAIKPEIIFHAAIYGGYPFQEDIDKIFRTNVMGTVNLVNACSEAGFDVFVNTGSSSEYGLKDRPMVETDLLEPIYDYSVSKAAATMFCQSKAKTMGLPIVTLRLFSVYGYHEEPTRLIPYVIMECLRGKNPKVSSPSYVRDFIFIEDVMDAYSRVIKASDVGGQIFNIGYGEQHSVAEVVKTIIKLTGSKVEPEWGRNPNWSHEPALWQADNSKAKNILKWKPKYSLEEGLAETVRWFKENRALYEGSQV
jgi:nucleoside-diphosphate-sugar epimerase